MKLEAPLYNRMLNPGFGIFLIIVFSSIRFILVLQANLTGNYQWVSVIFLIMIFLPLLLLKSNSLKDIGIQKPNKLSNLLSNFLLGVLLCLATVLISIFLLSEEKDWLNYISRSYQNEQLLSLSPLIIITSFLFITMTFSPIGEEFFYRGWVHRCFSGSIPDNYASNIDAGAFALVHLAHFGIVYQNNEWQFFPFASFLWILVMFLAGKTFYYAKIKSNSVWGAVCCHAGFNFTMSTYILIIKMNILNFQ